MSKFICLYVYCLLILLFMLIFKYFFFKKIVSDDEGYIAIPTSVVNQNQNQHQQRQSQHGYQVGNIRGLDEYSSIRDSASAPFTQGYAAPKY